MSFLILFRLIVATASVDTATDAVIQEMLRTRFRNTTLFTIAHRLDTIMDYDTIVVMQNGRCVEFGPPRELLGRENSIFGSFVDATGPESAIELRQMIAQEAPTMSTSSSE
jgi:ABC-type multidrug transport system fused ATPase/permease subunit